MPMASWMQKKQWHNKQMQLFSSAQLQVKAFLGFESDSSTFLLSALELDSCFLLLPLAVSFSA